MEPQSEDLQEFLRLQEARMEAAQAYVLERVDQVKIEGKRVEFMLQAARRSPSASDKIKWLHKAASLWAAGVAPMAACKKGCAHCCHIPVTISEEEARLLSKASGKPMTRPKNALPVTSPGRGKPDPNYIGVPCPFLKAGVCSVYQHRPMVCRTHMNMDVDDLLCRLVPGEATRVPYADSTRLIAAYLFIMSRNMVADIREYFPRKKTEVHDGPRNQSS